MQCHFAFLYLGIVVCAIEADSGQPKWQMLQESCASVTYQDSVVWQMLQGGCASVTAGRLCYWYARTA